MGLQTNVSLHCNTLFSKWPLTEAFMSPDLWPLTSPHPPRSRCWVRVTLWPQWLHTMVMGLLAWKVRRKMGWNLSVCLSVRLSVRPSMCVCVRLKLCEESYRFIWNLCDKIFIFQSQNIISQVTICRSHQSSYYLQITSVELLSADHISQQIGDGIRKVCSTRPHPTRI